ncbi:hypothetical protein [Paenibacillus sp. PCH8]|uniref:hypothetical protein n=1 Tax=Paenibacillus sp. PCH8 TaxID=2066524 RepID=UPI0015E4845C|nr:hypothetical protein [Paenibacillus sp. PCH8]
MKKKSILVSAFVVLAILVFTPLNQVSANTDVTKPAVPVSPNTTVTTTSHGEGGW